MFSFQVTFPVPSFYSMVAKHERCLPIKYSVPPVNLFKQANSTPSPSVTPNDHCGTLLPVYTYVTFGELPDRRGLVLIGLTSLDGVVSASQPTFCSHQRVATTRARATADQGGASTVTS
jgi:hypothetical protein